MILYLLALVTVSLSFYVSLVLKYLPQSCLMASFCYLNKAWIGPKHSLHHSWGMVKMGTGPKMGDKPSRTLCDAECFHHVQTVWPDAGDRRGGRNRCQTRIKPASSLGPSLLRHLPWKLKWSATDCWLTEWVSLLLWQVPYGEIGREGWTLCKFAAPPDVMQEAKCAHGGTK